MTGLLQDLEAALEPFADEAAEAPNLRGDGDDAPLAHRSLSLCVGDLRRAAAALARLRAAAGGDDGELVKRLREWNLPEVADRIEALTLERDGEWNAAIDAAAKAVDDLSEEIMKRAGKYHDGEDYDSYEQLESEATAVSWSISRIRSLKRQPQRASYLAESR